MLFGHLLEAEQDHFDAQLSALSQELREAINRAKLLARSCKIGNYEQTQYKITSNGDLICPQYKGDINYNEQFWKRYLKNQINFAIIKDISEKTIELEKQLKQIDSLSEEYQKLYKIKNRKKNRRLAAQIDKNFECPYEKCYRVYGSDVSLNLHIKLKHGGGNKTDREKLAEQICKAEEKGLPMPEMKFNLPLSYLDEYRKTYKERNMKAYQLGQQQ